MTFGEKIKEARLAMKDVYKRQPLRLVEPAQALPVCLSRTQLPFFQRSVCGHR